MFVIAFIIIYRKMTVHFCVSYNSSLEKDGKMAQSSSMIPSMLYAFASRKSECVPVFIYTV